MESAVRTLGPQAVLPVVPAALPHEFDELYTQHFGFVWRNVRRLGVPSALADDATQDVFVVVHRRLGDLRPDASVKGWLFGIALRVAHDYRRTKKRKPTVSYEVDSTTSSDRGPAEHAESAEAARLLRDFLDTLDDDKRAVFVLAELEELSAPEMSETLGVGVNTIYSRLRVARERFVDFIATHKAAHG